MNETTLHKLLVKLEACDASIKWQKGRSLKQAYDDLDLANWLLWFVGSLDTDKKRLTMAACACARAALEFIPEGEVRPLKAIETAEAWAKGKVDVKATRRMPSTLEEIDRTASLIVEAKEYTLNFSYGFSKHNRGSKRRAEAIRIAAHELRSATSASYAISAARCAVGVPNWDNENARIKADVAVIDAAKSLAAQGPGLFEAELGKVLNNMVPLVKAHLPFDFVQKHAEAMAKKLKL